MALSLTRRKVLVNVNKFPKTLLISYSISEDIKGSHDLTIANANTSVDVIQNSNNVVLSIDHSTHICCDLLTLFQGICTNLKE